MANGDFLWGKRAVQLLLIRVKTQLVTEHLRRANELQMRLPTQRQA